MTAGRAALVGLLDRYLPGLPDSFVTLLEAHNLMYFMQAAGEYRRRIACDVGVGIQDDSLSTPNARSISYGSGSKKLSGIIHPARMPTGRSFRGGFGRARISAIGTLRRHSTTVSPCSTRSRYFERRAFASAMLTLITVSHSSQPSSTSTRRRRSSAARASARACLNAATASGSGGTSSPMGGST